MLEAHPRPAIGDLDALVRCIEACGDCAAACTGCADADLGEDDVRDMVRCIRLCLDCADVCGATGRIVARQTEPDLGVIRSALETCVVACRASHAECRRHAEHHEHCRVCAEACSRCEQACQDLLAALG
jgi:hypothetical protein